MTTCSRERSAFEAVTSEGTLDDDTNAPSGTDEEIYSLASSTTKDMLDACTGDTTRAAFLRLATSNASGIVYSDLLRV